MKSSGLILIALFLLSSCESYTPKPKGYFRIEPPTPTYTQLSEEELPYSFEVSHIAIVELPFRNDPKDWINIAYPSLNAKIYCSYIPASARKLPEMINESRALVEKQARQAEIQEHEYSNPDNKVYGSLFEVSGEAASPVQFLLTDRQEHFFRGALYFESTFNADSLNPAIEYITNDIYTLIQTFNWK